MRKDELKQAAIRVFARRGYHAAKVSEIVAEAGVAQGTFYLYFPSKQALFGEILDDYLSLITGAVAGWDLTRVESLEQLRQDLKQVAFLLTQGMLRNQELTRIFFHEALAVDPVFNRHIAQFYDQVVALIGVVNRHCIAKGIYRPIDSDVLAQCVVGLIERVVVQYVVNSRVTEEESRRIVQEVIDLVLFGAAGTQVPAR
ncbi:MAG: TetR/AcrR family transcriptional regulator [Bradymonadales bacterium]|nr:TetR/AcrR family transcriptional regulator [Bradymonadales bacterium]